MAFARFTSRALRFRAVIGGVSTAVLGSCANGSASNEPLRDPSGDEWAPMQVEWLQLQVEHPAWDTRKDDEIPEHYLRPTFERVQPSVAAGPNLRELALRYFAWSRDLDNTFSGPTPIGNEEPWPWVWSGKPSIGSVVVVVGSGSTAASALQQVCASRDPLLTTVIAIGDEAALLSHGVPEKIGIIDAGVHSVDWEAKLLLSTPRDSGARPVLSDWHPEERLIFFDELICT